MNSPEEDANPPTGGTEPPKGLLVDSLERRHESGEQEAARRWVSGLFVDAIVGERRSGGRPLDRPRMAAIAAATIVCLGVSIGLAAWPGISYRLTHAGTAAHVAVKPRETTHGGAGQGQTAPQPGGVDTGAAGARSPLAEPIQSSSDYGPRPPAAAPQQDATPAAAA